MRWSERCDQVTFDLYIGIDYSGRETPTSRTPALQVYAAFGDEDPRRILSPSSTDKTHKNWCRKEIAEWFIEQAEKKITFIAGIDHGFSFPITYFGRYGLTTWAVSSTISASIGPRTMVPSMPNCWTRPTHGLPAHVLMGTSRQTTL